MAEEGFLVVLLVGARGQQPVDLRPQQHLHLVPGGLQRHVLALLTPASLKPASILFLRDFLHQLVQSVDEASKIDTAFVLAFS